jgi:hypothetical protein
MRLAGDREKKRPADRFGKLCSDRRHRYEFLRILSAQAVAQVDAVVSLEAPSVQIDISQILVGPAHGWYIIRPA